VHQRPADVQVHDVRVVAEHVRRAEREPSEHGKPEQREREPLRAQRAAAVHRERGDDERCGQDDVLDTRERGEEREHEEQELAPARRPFECDDSCRNRRKCERIISTRCETDSSSSRPVARAGLDLVDRVDDVHPGRDLAEDGVLAVEPRAGIGGDDEELRAVRVRAGVRHRESAALDLVVVELVLELVAGAARAGAGRVAALDHEVRDHAVEDDGRRRSRRCGRASWKFSTVGWARHCVEELEAALLDRAVSFVNEVGARIIPVAGLS
jgi:hypothetical protein